MDKRGKWLLSACLLVVLAATVHFFHLGLLRVLPDSVTSEFLEKRLIPKPSVARAFSLGYDRVLADYYWLLFAQYYGDIKARCVDKLVYAPDYLRLIVALDPHFIRAYWFTAFVLAGDLSGHYQSVRNAEASRQCLAESKRILDDGIAANQDDWTLPYIAGFSQYLFAKDCQTAAYYYGIAAKVPGAPSWLSKMKKTMQTGLSLRIHDEARMWALTFREANDSAAREHARKALQLIWSQVYWSASDAQLENIKQRSLFMLQYFKVELLAREFCRRNTSVSDLEATSR